MKTRQLSGPQKASNLKPTRLPLKPSDEKRLDMWKLRRIKSASSWYDARESDKRVSESARLSKSWDEALSSSWEALCAVLPLYKCLFTDIGADRRDFDYLARRSWEEGWPFLAETLPKLDKALLKGLSTGVFDPPCDFKCLPGERVPRFLRDVFLQVFTPSGELLEVGTSSPIAVQQLRQVFGFVYKADVPCDPDKMQDAVSRFIATESELSSSLSEGGVISAWEKDPVLSFASRLLWSIFRGYDRTSLTFKHGPGVTSNIPIEEKYEARLSPIPSVMGFGHSFFFNEDDESVRLSRYEPLGHRDLFQSRSTAALKLVPKDSRGPRIISAEPYENQWVQQGIRGYMYGRLEHDPLTRGHVNFTDQSVNRAMAYAASVTRNWATLDLKEASDRVVLPLVRRLFREVPELLSDLEATRSVATELPNGRLLPLIKFAPMGSALCFPVLAATIWSIVVAEFRLRGYAVQDAVELVYVYGDDVIVPSDLADVAIRALERYFLLVNKDKSFVRSRFAESCGFDAFDGNDVSPKRLRKCPTKNPELETLVSLVELGNELQRLGYAETAEKCYATVECSLGKLPYGYPCSPYLSRCFLPFMGESAWSVTLNRSKKVLRIDPLTTKPVWWVNAPFVVSTEKIKSSTVTFGGHCLRIYPQLGGSDLPAPGEFDKRRSCTLRVRRISEADSSPYPKSTWLPERETGRPKRTGA